MNRIASGLSRTGAVSKAAARLPRTKLASPASAAASAHAVSQARGYTAPMREINFLIKDVYDLEEHYKKLGVDQEMCGPDMVDMILDGSRQFCEEVIAPLNYTADDHGCKHSGPHDVTTPPGFKEAYDQYVEGGWQGLNYPEELGGQGLPYSLATFAAEMSATANWTWTMYPGLSKGAINTILAHGSDELKEKYLARMISGEWTGTMCLTEPQCGSDLNQVATKAEPIGDGKYKINGTKIFISCGEHDLTDNIIHCVLARLPGAPEGTRGISLFLVPKHKVSDEGDISEDYNGVNIGRIEDKMGCHGSSTCEINFEDAEGYLIGTENKGMSHMFTFINTSRLGTSVQGVAGAELSFQNALWYTKERRAFRALNGTEEPDQVADPIIVHPDIRKMLLTQKAIAEGGRSMIYEVALEADKMEKCEAAGDLAGAKKIDDRLGFLTPILKGFLTEKGLEAANLGIQIYGGHGYIKSNKQEQVLRDMRIAAIWEGTTGIQALDLLGRKIFGGKLAPLNEHCAGLRAQCQPHITDTGSVGSHARTLYWEALQWQLLAMRIGRKASSDKNAVGLASVDFLMYAGYVTLAEHWLKMEIAATEGLAKATDDSEKEFYKAKIQTADFVFTNILPRTKALKSTMLSDPKSVMGIKADSFSFDHSLA